MRRRGLNGLFDQLNVTFFRGRLPEYRVRRKATPAHMPGCSGWCDQSRRVIHIFADGPLEETRKVLLHEMCHHGAVGHGKRFQRKLERLAALGETWAQGERANYAEVVFMSIPLTATISYVIRDLATEHPDLDAAAALRIVARELCRPVSKLLRTAPWLPGMWNREARTARTLRAVSRNRRDKVVGVGHNDNG
jgi:hypothetical protein